MRGKDTKQSLAELSPTFDVMYASGGRPSVPPERLLKAMLLMALYSVRSERQFCEQLEYNLLFRWFLDMDMLESAFVPTVLTHNRERLLEHEVAAQFFRAIVEQARAKNLMSAEHFSVDGTLIEAWASAKSFRPKDDDDDDNNGWSDFSGTKRRNDTHESKTDPESKLWRKGKGRESKLSYMGHALMENRNGLLVGFGVTEASGFAERDAALALLNKAVPGGNRITLGADRGYDCRDFVERCRTHDVTPHVAQNVHQRSGIDRRTTRHPGYAVSIAVRRRIESIFGWLKTTAGLRRTRYRGRAKTELFGYLAAAAYNLVRISRLAA
ncbi:MAG: IS5 family transposase [Myxococcota bacterium]|nr:IS5 family transposase [Myxococcota bacterium]